MPIQELHEKVDAELQNDGYKTSLNNLTDGLLSLKIISNAPTVLTIERHRHKPFELEVIVDHTLTKKQDLVTRRKRSDTGGRSSFNYRYLWFGIIFFSTLVSLYFFFIEIFLKALDDITPGWSQLQQAIGIVIIILIIALFWILIIPIISKRKKEGMKKHDKKVLSRVCEIIDDLRVEIDENAVIRCWSCFKEIDRYQKLCPHCGEQQN